MAISDNFTGLPIGLLICQPLIEVARGQAELCKVYLDQLFRLAFKTMPDLTKAEAVEARTVTMEEATVNFTMEVKDSAADKLSETSEGSMESSLSVWGFSSTISGKVTTSRENTR